MPKWIIFKKGKVWCDRINEEWECIEIIEDGMCNGDSEDDYDYRIMTQEEIDDYY